MRSRLEVAPGETDSAVWDLRTLEELEQKESSKKGWYVPYAIPLDGASTQSLPTRCKADMQGATLVQVPNQP